MPRLAEIAAMLRKYAKHIVREGSEGRPWRSEYVNHLASRLDEGRGLSEEDQHDLMHIIADAEELIDA